MLCVVVPDEPFRHRPAAGPGVASSMDRVEHHGRVVRAPRVFEAGDVRRDRDSTGVGRTGFGAPSSPSHWECWETARETTQDVPP